MPQFEILPELKGYVNLARKKAKSDDIWSAIDILREGVSQYAQNRQRRDENEQQRQDRLRERQEDKTFALEQDMVNRQTAEIEDNAQAARKRQEKKREEDELNAKIEPHLPIVKQVRELLAQADSSLDDPIAKHQYLTKASHLTYDLPKEVTEKYPWLDDIGKDRKALESEIAADKRAREKEARDAAKNDLSANPEWQELTGAIKSKLGDLKQSNPELELPILLLQAEMFSKQPNPDKVLEMYNALVDGIKNGNGEQPPSSLSGRPLTKQQAEQAEGFSYDPELTEEAEQGASLFGGTGQNLNIPDSLYTPTKPLDQYEYMIQQETEALVEAGAFPDTPRGRAFARTKATEKVDKQFPGKAPKKGKYQPDVSAVEAIMLGVEKENSINLSKTVAEVKARYPRLDEALEGDPTIPGSMEAADRFRKMLDSTYFEGISDYLSHGVIHPDVIEPDPTGGYPRE